MRPVILGAARRQRGRRVIKVNFVPAKIADFAAPLAGEEEQPDDVAVVVGLERTPYSVNLVIGEHAIPRRLRSQVVATVGFTSVSPSHIAHENIADNAERARFAATGPCSRSTRVSNVATSGRVISFTSTL
jgi:hypothetical protein